MPLGINRHGQHLAEVALRREFEKRHSVKRDFRSVLNGRGGRRLLGEKRGGENPEQQGGKQPLHDASSNRRMRIYLRFQRTMPSLLSSRMIPSSASSWRMRSALVKSRALRAT